MRKTTLSLVLAMTCLAGSAAQSLETIVALEAKAACTMADLSSMSQAIVDAVPGNSGLASRLKLGLAAFKPGRPLTKERASLVVARSLGIRSSFFFLLIPVERYAFRAFVVEGIFGAASSGGEVMSGTDLMGFVSDVCRKYGVAP